VADEIRITVCAFQLEISVVRRQPGVEYFRDGYPTTTKNQRAWRLLAAMACVALNIDAEQPLFRHLIHRPHWHDRNAEGMTVSTSCDRNSSVDSTARAALRSDPLPAVPPRMERIEGDAIDCPP
jgi:hypothetical protein